MPRIREVALLVTMGLCGSVLYHQTVRADGPPPAQEQGAAAPADPATRPEKLVVTVGKTLIIDSPIDIKRVHVANGTVAEAVPVAPKEVLVNGTAPGETSLIVWQVNGARLVYDLTVRMSGQKLEAARQQIAKDFPDDDIALTFENDTPFVRGTVKDVTAADRVMSIAATLGKPVNLLNVLVPPVQPQVMLKVRFANVDRQAGFDLGLNFYNTSFNQQSSLGTGPALFPDATGRIPVPSVVNLLLIRPDINLVSEIQALQTKRMLELLAEPNLLAISGQEASFLAGGEFPFPTVQPGQGSAAISIQWKEYGVRLHFTPVVTPRGTIRLHVEPEVSSLDYTNAVTVLGVTVPALTKRSVGTDVELESGQSFVLAGLLDNQTSENLSKVPGIGNIPVLGKLFQSKSISRNNSELLVLITPELVRPIPAGQPAPEITFTSPFLPKNTAGPLMQPSMDKTGPVPVKPPTDTVPYEQLVIPAKKEQAPTVPMIVMMPQQGAAGGTSPAAMSGAAGGSIK